MEPGSDALSLAPPTQKYFPKNLISRCSRWSCPPYPKIVPAPLIGDGTYLDDATPYYLKYNILKLNDLYKLEIGKFFHSFIHNFVHPSFTKFFIRSSDVATRTTRSSVNLSNLCIPRYKANRMQRSIKYQNVKIWNSIPHEIQKLPKNAFKNKLKLHLIQSYKK